MIKCYDNQMFCMGTVITQRVFGENGDTVIEIVNNEMKQIEQLMSFFKEDSEVSKLNKAAGENEVILSSSTFEVIKKSKFFSELCNETFDITIAPLVKLWGIFTKDAKVPSQNEIDAVLNLVNYKDVIINDNNQSIKLAKKGMMVDLGAIAKGYAADRAIEIYKQNSIKSAFINIGGNVVTLGNKPDGLKWKVGLQDPLRKRGEYLGIMSIADKSIVTSGDYVRYYESGNVRYHHIISPITGHPTDSGITSATIISNKSIDGDALSTAIFILGVDEGLKLVKKLDDVEAIFITKEKKVIVTEGLKGDFNLTNEEFTIEEAL